MLSSYSESFPYALLEGGRRKKATVSTLAGGVSEMIKDGETGFLSPVGDWESLGRNMEKVLDDPRLKDRLGESFYNDIKENFSLTAMAKRHLKIYEEVIKNEK